jgi:molybdopterin-synthase adenylyltransferase
MGKMTTQDYTRQIGILDPDSIIFPVTLIGCGGIGSPTALMLAKLGCPKLTLIDPDRVEKHNLPNQLFPLADLGQLKVEASRRVIEQFSDCQVAVIPEFFGRKISAEGIVISGVDSMQSRKIIWRRIKYNINVPLYIDGRIGAEIIQVFTIRPSRIEDIELYEDYLFSDKKAAELPCTERAIIYTAFSIAGLIGAQLKKWLKKEDYQPRISFDLKTMSIV